MRINTISPWDKNEQSFEQSYSQMPESRFISPKNQPLHQNLSKKKNT
jgi:hypothetical protein